MSKRRTDTRARRQAAERARQEAERRARQRRRIVTAAAVVLLLVAGVTGYFVYRAQRPERSSTAPAAADASGIKVGSGPVTVDIYLDFMCPVCKDFESRAGDTLDGLVRDGKVTIVYHPVAFLDRFSSGTKYSTRSSAASACAADTGKFAEYLKVLYANQPKEGSTGLTDDRLIELAGTAGVDKGPFGDCVRAGTHKAWVDGVTEQATKAGVNGTPTVLVNGKQVDPTPDAITAAVKR